ncbi:DUF5367 family protein [Sphingobacterium hungaricum]|uniref:Uncharacterized protein n=1 Tax=Sphingobacterium hungaricum TaxID=2082723 RepID=A0A928V0S5_9SPHI|nr:DUF5367 family protein [Sphingobacterium hungaricum]MBE8715010.1 hypothetical protein [Sphingobacterium hungaricum]
MNYKRYSFCLGFFIWAIATFAFRYFGHLFFLTDRQWVVITLFAGTALILGIISHIVFNKFRLSKPQSVHAAALLVLPGMLLDSLCLFFFDLVFPTLPSTDGTIFSSWLMWAYACVLVFGLIRKRNIARYK